MSSQVVSSNTFLYPWLSLPFLELTRSPIPHSLLLFAQKDLGELHFGLELANYLLCESVDNKPCGHCEACHWVRQGNHPDLFIIVPQALKHLLPFEVEDEKEGEDVEEKKQSKFIRIEQIRRVITSNELGSYRGGKRVVLIYPIEAMQAEAANCLLKTLEEPSSQLYFILMTNQLEKILPTIRSRCHLFPIPRPALEFALGWLKSKIPQKFSDEILEQKLALHAGSPLKVISSLDEKALDDSVITQQLSQFKLLHSGEIIELLGQYALLDILNSILKWSFDMNLVLFGLKPRYFPHLEDRMKMACSQLNKKSFQQFLASLKDDIRLANHPLFPKVQLDAVLMRYKQLF
jgi:DNA polymerase-3 subunit delta'